VKYWTGLLLIAVGAVLAFAVTIHTSAFDPRMAGYLIIMTGVLSMTFPRRTASRVKREVLVHHYYRPRIAEPDEDDS
jgi:uncharacterized protein DUF6458